MKHDVLTDSYSIRYSCMSHRSPGKKSSPGSHGDSSAAASIQATTVNNRMCDVLNIVYCVRDHQDPHTNKNKAVTEASRSWDACDLPHISEETSTPQPLLYCYRGVESPLAVLLTQLHSFPCSFQLSAVLRCLSLMHHHLTHQYPLPQRRRIEGGQRISTWLLRAASTFRHWHARGYKGNAFPRTQNASS